MRRFMSAVTRKLGIELDTDTGLTTEVGTLATRFRVVAIPIRGGEQTPTAAHCDCVSRAWAPGRTAPPLLAPVSATAQGLVEGDVGNRDGLQRQLTRGVNLLWN